MAHIYMTFDFGTDEEKAQQARHKLDGWKQAFRLDKKLLYKFERPVEESDGAARAQLAPAKKETAKDESTKGGKGRRTTAASKSKGSKEKEEKSSPAPAPSGPVKLHLRLAFSGYEKMTEERWLKRIQAEEPFREAEPETVKASDANFAEIEAKFDTLEG